MTKLDWVTNDPEAARLLRAVDRAYTRATAKAANWPLKEKVAAIRRARETRDASYQRVRARLGS